LDEPWRELVIVSGPWYSAAVSEKLRYGNTFQPLIRWVAEFSEDGCHQPTYRIKKAQLPIPD
jgi:hypothetical protein